jgi:2'-5' RNA ligase
LAHISLVEFKSGLEESRILEKSTMALKNMTKFSVNVNGHFVFAHGATRSLVLQLQEEKHIEGMANLLRTEFYEKIASKKPHLTIARSIPVKSFETIADDLSSYNYEDEFLCSSVTILRKPIGVNKRYSKMHEIHFDN